MRAVTLNLALDWFPNMMHAGILLAYYKGWYAEQGIQVNFLSPEDDNYAKGVDEKLLEGSADIGIGPLELALAHQNEVEEEAFIALTALFHRDCSALASLKSNNFSSLKDFSGKKYAALNIPFEAIVINNALKNAGASQELNFVYNSRLQSFESLKAGEVDLCWIFSPIELNDAKRAGIDLQLFSFADLGIPYPPNPHFLLNKAFFENNFDAVRKFMEITGLGYKNCVQFPDMVAGFLARRGAHPYIQDKAFNLACLNDMAPFLLDDEQRWGGFQFDAMEKFKTWLETQILVSNIPL